MSKSIDELYNPDLGIEIMEKEYLPSSPYQKDKSSDLLFKRLVATPERSDNNKQTTPDPSSDEEPVLDLANLAQKAPKKAKHILQRRNVLKPKKLTMEEASVELLKKSIDKKHKIGLKNMKDLVLKLQNKRIVDNDGTWVECCKKSCSKFRYLDEIKDPIHVPSKWYCSMNKDFQHNSCQAPEEMHNTYENILLKYVAGSIVWAKRPGYPPCPAMVDDDPHILQFFWFSEHFETPTHYHVVFLDDKVSRAWVSVASMEPFYRGGKPKFSSTVYGKDYESKIEQAIVKANLAIDMAIKDRLLKFSFVRNYTGPWPPSPQYADVDSTTASCRGDSPQITAKDDQDPLLNSNSSNLEPNEIMLGQMSELDANLDYAGPLPPLLQSVDADGTTASCHGDSREIAVTDDRDQLLNLNDSYLKQNEIMLSQLSELESSLEMAASQQLSFGDDINSNSQPEKLEKQAELEKKKNKTLREKGTDDDDVYVKSVLSDLSELEASFDSRLEKESKGPSRKKTLEPKGKNIADKKMKEARKKPGTAEAGMEKERPNIAPKKVAPKERAEKEGIKAIPVRKRSKSSGVEKPVQIAGEKKVKRSASVDIISNADNKIKPVFKNKKSQKKSMETVASRAKVSEGPESDVLNPEKNGVETSGLGSQDLFPRDLLADSQIDKMLSSMPKDDVEFSFDSLLTDELKAGEE